MLPLRQWWIPRRVKDPLKATMSFLTGKVVGVQFSELAQLFLIPTHENPDHLPLPRRCRPRLLR